jgi:hypothetical protein
MLASMDCLHNDVISVDAEIDRVGEAPQDRPTCLLMNLRIAQGILRNAPYHFIDGPGEGAAQTWLPPFVPSACFLQFVFGLGPEDNTTCHGSPEQPSTDIGPWHGRIWVGYVLSPTPIELGAQLVGDFQGVISFTVGKALPQRDGQLRAILSGQFEEIWQGVGCHARSSHGSRHPRNDRH